jgi:SpoVK/Ycf46/Vps4 family AAA+-type ATPase
MTQVPQRIPKSVFHAQTILQRARYHDHQDRYRSAVKYYLQATKLLTTVLKQHPSMPIHTLWARETRLCLDRINQLKLRLFHSSTNPSAPPADSSSRNSINSSTSSPSASRSDEQYAEMRQRILKCRVAPDPSLSWGDVIGLDQVVFKICEAIEFPLNHPEVLRNGSKPPRSILLFGPPGCGKTFLIKVLAAECGLPLFHITAADLLSKWHGESQKMIRVLYETAWEFAPSIIFIDEFDGVFGNNTSNRHPLQRGSETSQITTQLQEELQQFLDGLQTPSVNQTVTIVATNYPWRLRPPQIRRFDFRLYIAPPSIPDIARLFTRFLSRIPHALTDQMIQWLANEFQGHTPDEILKICTAAYYDMVRSSISSSSGNDSQVPSKPKQLRLVHFLGLADQMKPMLRFVDLDGVGLVKFRNWNKHSAYPEIIYPKHYWEWPESHRTGNTWSLVTFWEEKGINAKVRQLDKLAEEKEYHNGPF